MKPINEMTSADVLALIKGVDKKTWIKIGVGSLVFMIFLNFIGGPAWIQRWEVKGKTKSVKEQIRNLQTMVVRKPVLQKTKEKQVAYINNAKEKLYQPGETSLLLGAVSKMANESKISIISSSPKEFNEKFPAPFDTQYEANLYDFTVEGGYHEVATLIATIESNPKLLRVQTFQLKPNLNKAQGGKIISTLTISAVSAKEQAAPAPAPATKP